MKKLSILIVALFGIQLSALAAGKTMVNYSFGHEAQPMPTPYSYEKVDVSIDESGLVGITATTRSGFDNIGPAKYQSHQLSDSALEHVRNQLLSLSDAELQESYSDIVCMIAVSPAQMTDHLSVATDWDWQKRQFNGDLRLIMGPEGCWVRHHIAPKTAWKASQARNLKSLLQFIALDVAGDLLK